MHPMLCVSLIAQALAGDSTRLAAAVDSVFAVGMAREHIHAGAVVIVRNGRVVLAKGFGAIDADRGFAADRSGRIIALTRGSWRVLEHLP